MTSHLDLDSLTLENGSHDGPDDGYCVMEAVAYFAHEPWSDHPQCASPAITAFLMTWNDNLSDDDRQRLKRFIPMVVGTRTTPEDEVRRAWMATDWLVRTFAPAWLDTAGLAEAAARLRGIEELTSDEVATAALPVIGGAHKEASAARSAAWSAAWSAARSAADAALAPTVKQLQASAEQLVERMIAVGKTEAVPA